MPLSAGPPPPGQQLPQDVQNALAGAFAMRRRLHESRRDLRTQAARVAHFVNPARLHDVREEIRRTTVPGVLPVEVTAALQELPSLLLQHGSFHARLGTRPVEGRTHVVRKVRRGLLQRPAELPHPQQFGRIRPVFLFRFHDGYGQSVRTARAGPSPTYRPTNSATRRVYSARLSR